MKDHLKRGFGFEFALIVIIGLTLFKPSFPQGKNYVAKNEFYPGDALSINFIDVYKQKDRGVINISGEYAIDSRGYILLPLVGALKVVGYNRYTLAEKLVEVYKSYFTEPYISITPLIRITISGPFYKPGAYRVNPQASLWDVLEKAGGPQGNCDLNSISVVRNDEVVIENLLAGFEKGYSLEDIGVQSGDQIVAKPKRHFGLREIFDYLRFGMSIASLYFLVLRWQNYKK
ncbi:MAG: hypothetical protein GXO74_07985 [Calditrichaeota bacterium]|nr:hypothetical protein [Calditrichota bacterium]